MNLRDLIFSQSNALSIDNIVLDVKPQYSSQKYSAFTDSSSEEEEHDAIVDKIENVPQRHTIAKHLGRYPLIQHKSQMNKYYRESPEIMYSLELKSQKYMPGHDSYIKFAQVERPILSIYRDIARSIWYRCYYAKDFEGAAMAIKVLAEVDSIGVKDLLRFAEMLQYHYDPSTQIRILLQNAIKQKVIKKRSQERITLLKMFAELFMSQSDIISARKFIQGRQSDTAFNSSACLLAFDVIVLCNQIILETSQLAVEFPQTIACLPSVEDVINKGPLQFYRCVRLLHVLCALPAIKIKCTQLLNDLKTAFNLCSLLRSKCQWMDLHALYVAYLEGIRQHKQACKHLKKINKMLLSIGGSTVSPNVSDNEGINHMIHSNKFILQKCYKLLMEHTAMFGSQVVFKCYNANKVDVTAIVKECSEVLIVNTLKWLKGKHDFDPSEWPLAIYCGIQLFRLKKVNTSFLLDLVANGIENIGMTHSSILLNWLWKLLSAILRCDPLRIIELNDRMSSSSELAQYFSNEKESSIDDPMSVWKEGIIHNYETKGLFEEDSALGSGIVSEVLNSQSEFSFNESESEVNNVSGPFRLGRKWWKSTVLCVDQLGQEFSDSVLEFEVVKSLNRIHATTASNNEELDEVMIATSKYLQGVLSTDVKEWFSDSAQFNNDIADVLGENVESGEDMDYSIDSDSSTSSNISIKLEPIDQHDQSVHNLSQSVNKLMSPMASKGHRRASPGHHSTLSDEELQGESLDIRSELCLITSQLSRKFVSFSASSLNVSVGEYSFLSQSYWSPDEVASMEQFHLQQTEYLKLNGNNFERLTNQVIVASYLYTQDSLFVVKGLQLMMENVLHTVYSKEDSLLVSNCIRKLEQTGVDVVRGIRIASQLASLDVLTYIN